MSENENQQQRPSFFRHIAIISYDLFLLLATYLVTTFIIVILNQGEAISQGNPFFLAFLFMLSFFFYGWFWTHGGQTIGMRSWKVKLYSHSGTAITWQQALVRYLFAIAAWLPLGAGFWWQFIMKNNQSWPDLFSGTYLIYDKTASKKTVSPLS